MVNIINMEHRLRDGRAVQTDADYFQWLYEHLNDLSQDIGRDYVPSETFPIFVRIMCEWAEGVRGCGVDAETASTLLDAIAALTACLRKFLPPSDGQAGLG
jgi:hypothetical protein